MKRRAGIALLALGAPLLVTPSAQAADEQCLEHPMQTVPGLTWQQPEAVAPAGRYAVGRGEHPGLGDSIVRWHDGVPAEIGVNSASGLSVNAVSDDGQIVYTTPQQSFRYRDGRSEELPAPAGYAVGQASGIDNTHGVIVGRVLNAEQTAQRAISWDATNHVRLLALLPGFTESSAAGVADDGTIVGSLSDWDPDAGQWRAVRAAYWRPDGAVVLLPMAASATTTSVSSIQNGLLIGWQDKQLVSWRLGSDADPTPLTTAAPLFTNAKGTVLYADDTVGKPGAAVRHLERADPGTATNLHPLGVTYDDQVLGWDEFVDHPVRWDCS